MVHPTGLGFEVLVCIFQPLIQEQKQQMLRKVKQVCGDKFASLDGEIGHVKSFYFDVQNWAVRYIGVETGVWLTSRQVLIPPHAIRPGSAPGNVFTVNLTRKQIESGPELVWHKPVSREYEEEYYHFYGWPRYWEVDSPCREIDSRASHPSADAHLRTTQTVNGYDVQRGGEIIGHVSDFLFDDESWVIRELAMKACRPLGGGEVQFPTSSVIRISYPDSTVFVDGPYSIASSSSSNETAAKLVAESLIA